MYCSFRFYVDKRTDFISGQNLIGVFDLFASVLGWSYDYISYMLFDPDSDRMLIDDNYSYDFDGKKKFLNTYIPESIIGKYGRHINETYY